MTNISATIRRWKNLPQLLAQNSRHLENIHAQLYLSQVMPEKSYFPVTGFSIQPITLVHLINDLIVNDRSSIIEFGGGLSTLCIAKAIKLNDKEAQFITVDSDLDWIKLLKQLLKKEGLSDYVNLIYAPLISSDWGLTDNYQWYSVKHLEDNIEKLKFDMIIVDGPKGANSKYSRHGALPFVKKYLAEDYLVCLDDTDRFEEQKIAQELTKMLDIKPIKFHTYTLWQSRKQYSSWPIAYNH